MLRRYTLCSPSARESIDLRTYEKKIVKAIQAIKPDAYVRVEKDCYYTDLTRGEAIRAGKVMSEVFPDSAFEVARKLVKGEKWKVKKRVE